jgi:hypothetical protein
MRGTFLSGAIWSFVSYLINPAGEFLRLTAASSSVLDGEETGCSEDRRTNLIPTEAEG